MTIRSFTLVALMTVLSSSSGCTGMKNFMFGRGAGCGLCNRARAIGTAVNPLAPAPQTPAGSGCRLPGCGLFGRNQSPAYAPPMAYAPAPMCAPSYGPDYAQAQGEYADPGYSSAMPGDCSCGSDCGGTCGSVNQGGAAFQGGAVDPYLGSGSYQGGAVMQGDGFQSRGYDARRFDEQGDRIISQDPMPSEMGASGMQFTN